MNSIEHQQQRGAGWDVVDEALNAYDEWMLDDDYEPMVILRKIVTRMRERREMYSHSSRPRCDRVSGGDQHD